VPLVLITRDGHRPLPTTLVSGQELVALDDVVSAFQVTVREDTLAGGVTVTYKGRSVVLSPEQPMASVNGRLVALPSPLVRSGRRWLVPVEFLSRGLAPIYDSKIELRKPSRLILVGDVRVPRVTARVEGAGPPTHVVLEVTPSAPVIATIEPTRVVVHIDADAIDVGGPTAGVGLVEHVRAGDQPRTVVVTLRPGVGPVRTTTAEADGSMRLTIDVGAAGGSPTVAAPAAAPPVGDIPFINRPTLQTIAIDPGHGGEDGGVRGAGDVLEKQITLDTARRLKSMIETRLGIRVVLTRDDDQPVALDARAAFANNSKADLFLSLHANAAFGPGIAGAEVFYLSVDSDIEKAREAAQADTSSLPVLGGGSRRVELLRWDMAQASHIDASATLATMLETSLRAQQVPMSDRPVQRAPLRVLVGANMPAALLEIGYLTSPDQVKQLATPEFQTSVAQAIFDAVLQFRGYLEQGQ